MKRESMANCSHKGCCNSSYTFALIARKLCHQLSVNGSGLERVIVRRVCRFCVFGTIALPRKLFSLSREILPVLHVSLVLEANFLWQNGKALVAKKRFGI